MSLSAQSRRLRVHFDYARGRRSAACRLYTSSDWVSQKGSQIQPRSRSLMSALQSLFGDGRRPDHRALEIGNAPNICRQSSQPLLHLGPSASRHLTRSRTHLAAASCSFSRCCAPECATDPYQRESISVRALLERGGTQHSGCCRPPASWGELRGSHCSATEVSGPRGGEAQ
jgi:hypothetical protein